MAGINVNNLRDTHMMDTWIGLPEFHGLGTCYCLEHNTHIGDARFTDMAMSEIMSSACAWTEEDTVKQVLALYAEYYS